MKTGKAKGPAPLIRLQGARVWARRGLASHQYNRRGQKVFAQAAFETFAAAQRREASLLSDINVSILTLFVRA